MKTPAQWWAGLKHGDNVIADITARDAEHRAELLKLQDDLLSGANREVMAEALIKRLRGELGEARGFVRRVASVCGQVRQPSPQEFEALRIVARWDAPPPAESTPVCTACPGPALLGACSHPGCEVNKESREVGRMMRENDKDGLATYLTRNVAAKAKRAAERINAAETKHVLGMIRNPPPPTDALKAAMARTPPVPPDDIRERLERLEARMDEYAAAQEAKGEPGTHAFVCTNKKPEVTTDCQNYCRCAVPGCTKRLDDHPKGAKP